MSCLWGLPITGEPITGFTNSARFQGRLYELLGVKDDEVKGFMKKRGNDTYDMLIAKKAVRERFKTLPTDANDEQLKWLVFFYLQPYSYLIFLIMYSHFKIDG